MADADDTLLDAIEKTAAETTSGGGSVQFKAGVLRDLALAYRYVIGGPQPGSSSSD